MRDEFAMNFNSAMIRMSAVSSRECSPRQREIFFISVEIAVTDRKVWNRGKKNRNLYLMYVASFFSGCLSLWVWPSWFSPIHIWSRMDACGHLNAICVRKVSFYIYTLIKHICVSYHSACRHLSRKPVSSGMVTFQLSPFRWVESERKSPTSSRDFTIFCLLETKPYIGIITVMAPKKRL